MNTILTITIAGFLATVSLKQVDREVIFENNYLSNSVGNILSGKWQDAEGKIPSEVSGSLAIAITRMNGVDSYYVVRGINMCDGEQDLLILPKHAVYDVETGGVKSDELILIGPESGLAYRYDLTGVLPSHVDAPISLKDDIIGLKVSDFPFKNCIPFVGNENISGNELKSEYHYTAFFTGIVNGETIQMGYTAEQMEKHPNTLEFLWKTDIPSNGGFSGVPILAFNSVANRPKLFGIMIGTHQENECLQYDSDRCFNTVLRIGLRRIDQYTLKNAIGSRKVSPELTVSAW